MVTEGMVAGVITAGIWIGVPLLFLAVWSAFGGWTPHVTGVALLLYR